MREITNELAPEPFRWTAEGLLAMQEVSLVPTDPVMCWWRASGTNRDSFCMVQATEDFLVHLFEDCNLCAIHAKRVTISTPPTSKLAAALSGLICLSGVQTFACCCWLYVCSSSDLLQTDGAEPCWFCAVPKDLQLSRRIRGPIAGVSSY